MQEFIELCRKKDPAGAITYARKNLAPWASTHMSDIRLAMTLLAFGERTEVLQYSVSDSFGLAARPDRVGHVSSWTMGPSERTIPRRVLIALCSSGSISPRSVTFGRTLHSPPPLLRAIPAPRRPVAPVANDPAPAGRTAPSHTPRILHVPPGSDVVVSDSVIAAISSCRT